MFRINMISTSVAARVIATPVNVTNEGSRPGVSAETTNLPLEY
ncbi:hypothetical protein [Amycolatopsis sp. lyj-112]